MSINGLTGAYSYNESGTKYLIKERVHAAETTQNFCDNEIELLKRVSITEEEPKRGLLIL